MKITKYFGFILVFFVIHGCKKNPADGSKLNASLNVVNAIASEDSDIKVNCVGKIINYANVITHSYYNFDGKGNYNGSGYYGLSTNMDLPLLIVRRTDTLKSIYNVTRRFEEGDFYTLYLAGQVDAIDPILIKENIPARTDSTTGVRFINLCQDCGTVDINILDSPVGSFATKLPYKSMTKFKSLPAISSISGYDFQVTDPLTGNELVFYTYWNLARMKNVTLVLRGLKNGSVFLEVVRINN